MKKLQIVNIDKNENYTLMGKNDSYNIVMYFYDVEKEPSVNDTIYIDEKVLDEKIELRYSNLNSTYGRDIKSEEDADILILVDENQKRYVYKRIYG